MGTTSNKALEHYNFALQAASEAKFKLAISGYKKAIKADPKFFEAHCNIGNLYDNHENKAALALSHYETANKLSPNHAVILTNLGNIWRKFNDSFKAISFYEKALNIDPNYKLAKQNLINLYLNEGEFVNAETLINELLMQGENRIIVYLLSLSQISVRKHPGYYSGISKELNNELLLSNNDQAAIKKLIYDLQNHSGSLNLLIFLSDYIIDLPSVQHSTLLEKLLDSIHSNKLLRFDYFKLKGKLALKKSFYKESLNHFREASLIKNDPTLFSLLAEAYFWLGRPVDAQSCINKSKGTIWNGEYATWHEFRQDSLEVAWRLYNDADGRRRLSNQKPELTKSLPFNTEESIYLFRTEGIGDEIMFLSCLPTLLSKHRGRITIECSDRLIPIIERSFSKINLVSSLADTKTLKSLRDTHNYLYSLSEICGILRPNVNAFTQLPFFICDPLKKQQSTNALEALPKKINVGVAWKGGSKNFSQLAKAKSALLSDFLPLLTINGVNWINLQYGDVDQEINALYQSHGIKVHDFKFVDPLNDIDSQLALIDSLDLVIQTSNASAHLAGALGKKTWLLTGSPPDWRWFTKPESNLSPWYRDFEVIEKNPEQSWYELSKMVSVKLKALMKLDND